MPISLTDSNRMLATFALVCLYLGLSGYAYAEPKPFTVVIDPGHGGADLGTVYTGGKFKVAEKNVTLALAKEVARQIEARGMNAVLTRSDDRDVALPHRTGLANRLKADLFISIHMNSTKTPMVTDAEGVETYILNNTTDAPSKRLAYLENKVLGESPVPTQPSSGGNDVALILKELQLDANQNESKHIACLVQSKLTRGLAGNKSRGVRQALFYVLLGADMPSMLLEAGFLTSPRDRKMVQSLAGRRSIALGLAQAVEQFKKSKGTALAFTEMNQCQIRDSGFSTGSPSHRGYRKVSLNR